VNFVVFLLLFHLALIAPDKYLHCLSYIMHLKLGLTFVQSYRHGMQTEADDHPNFDLLTSGLLPQTNLYRLWCRLFKPFAL